MALINCSECKKEISNTAKTCPNCGAPVVIDFDKSIVEDKVWTYTSNFFRGLLTIIIIIVAFSYLFDSSEKENVINYKEKHQSIDNYWDKFDPLVKERIELFIQNKDCNELQKEFNAADKNVSRFRQAGGSSKKHLELMRFIDDNMRKIGCY